MNRLAVCLATATSLALAGAPAAASPAVATEAVRDAAVQLQADCVPVGDEECIPLEDITENTTLFVDWNADGSLRGFTDFNAYAQWLKDKYGITVTLVGNRVVFDFGSEEQSAVDDSAVESGSNTNALWATFYSRGDFTGTGFVLDPPNIINDLRDVHYPGGGNWDNRISSVVTTGGAMGGRGAALCARVGCLTNPGWTLRLDNQVRRQLLGGFNNSASYVGVFDG